MNVRCGHNIHKDKLRCLLSFSEYNATYILYTTLYPGLSTLNLSQFRLYHDELRKYKTSLAEGDASDLEILQQDVLDQLLLERDN